MTNRQAACHYLLVLSCWATLCSHTPVTASSPHTAAMKSRTGRDQMLRVSEARLHTQNRKHDRSLTDAIKQGGVPVGGGLVRGAVRRVQLRHDHLRVRVPRRVTNELCTQIGERCEVGVEGSTLVAA